MKAACVVYSDETGHYSVTMCRAMDRLALEALAAAVVRACVEAGADAEGVLRLASSALVTGSNTVPTPMVIRGEAG